MKEASALVAHEVTKFYSVGRAGRHSLVQSLFTLRSRSTERFRALDGVSFEIPTGTPMGIVGNNGAGKSTLLRVLAGITRPSSGHVQLRGRIGTLLEVGTGFHPELTGRENVFLSGSILGLSREDVRTRFDDIVEFSGVGRFLDTPVKHYSSGMYVRLGFSVAAHMEPDILIVDEVLAVGDVGFQRRCLGRMDQAAAEGRTVIFVSHNLGALKALTRQALWLDGGRLVDLGDTGAVVSAYTSSLGVEGPADLTQLQRPSGVAGGVALIAAQARAIDRRSGSVNRQILEISVTCESNRDAGGGFFAVTITGADGQAVGSSFSGPVRLPDRGKRETFLLAMADHRLAPGQYVASLSVGERRPDGGKRALDMVERALRFEIEPIDVDGVMEEWFPEWGSVQLPSLEARRA